MSLNLTRASAELCGNLCNDLKEFCVRPTQYIDPYFCISKTLFKRGLRYKDVAGKLMKSKMIFQETSDQANTYMSAMMFFIAISFLILALIMIYAKYYLLKKRETKNVRARTRRVNVIELQSFDNINFAAAP